MKICEYIPTASFFVGGGEIYPLLQTKSLAKAGHDVTLVVLKTEFESEYFIKYRQDNPKLNIVKIESPIESCNSFAGRELSHKVAHELYFSLGRAFSFLCAKNDFDLVITHYGPGAVSCPSNIKQILFLHGVPSTIQSVNIAAVIAADKLVAVSKSVADGWKKMFKVKKEIDIIYNAVDIQAYYPTNTKKNIDILYLGRLIEIKGVQHLIQAVKILKDMECKLKLIVAGKGPYENELKKMVKVLRLEKEVAFLGYINESDKLELYNRAKICVFPSYAKEGVLTTMLEAASTATAIVTANCCGMIDFIDNGVNGLLFEPQNAKDMAEKIMLLINDSDMAQNLGRNARKSVERSWNWEYHAKAVENIIKSM
jgi:glycosyltransferase involved in cell wall biosynthesis